MADSWTEPLTQGAPGYAGQQRDTALAFAWMAAGQAAENTDKLLAAAAADEVRDKAQLAAIEGLAAALKAGGGNVDVAAVVGAVNTVRDEARAKFAEMAAENADLRAQLARAVAAAEANLSPAERASLDAAAS